jgi:hypothetical protein
MRPSASTAMTSGEVQHLADLPHLWNTRACLDVRQHECQKPITDRFEQIHCPIPLLIAIARHHRITNNDSCDYPLPRQSRTDVPDAFKIGEIVFEHSCPVLVYRADFWARGH